MYSFSYYIALKKNTLASILTLFVFYLSTQNEQRMDTFPYYYIQFLVIVFTNIWNVNTHTLHTWYQHNLVHWYVIISNVIEIGASKYKLMYPLTNCQVPIVIATSFVFELTCLPSLNYHVRVWIAECDLHSTNYNFCIRIVRIALFALSCLSS